MADAASLRDRIETAVFRGALRLPPAVQGVLAGPRRVRADGQLLHPEAQLMVRLLDLSGRPAFDEVPVPEAREDARREAVAAAGPPLPVAAVEERTLPGAGGDLRARLYVPAETPDADPLLVYLHGGGWVIGDLETHDQVCRFLAREAAVRVLSIDYRLAPEHPFPAAVEDCAAALRYALTEAERLGADPARVAVGGDSAGGNLAAVTARLLAAEGRAPAMQLLIYPVTDLSRKRRSYELFREGFFLTERQMDWYRERYLPSAEAALDPRVSPLLATDLSGLPRAHVALAGFDVLRDEGQEYADRLAAAGVPVTISRHTGLIHGFTHAAPLGRAASAAMREIAAALSSGLRVPAPAAV